jgi:hypothetical protein
MSVRISALISGVVVLASCGQATQVEQPKSKIIDDSYNSSDVTRDSTQTATAAPMSVSPSTSVTLTATEIQVACKKAIAELMGQPTNIMKSTINGEMVRVKYNRPDDGKLWTNECKFEGNNIVYRSIDLDGPNSGPGRWRDSGSDEKITWSKTGGKVEVSVNY